MNSTPPQTVASAAEPSDLPAQGRITDYDRLVEDLVYTYEGIFSRDSIARAVADAREALEPTATIPDFLPILVSRSAQEQLTAAARADGHLIRPIPELLVRLRSKRWRLPDGGCPRAAPLRRLQARQQDQFYGCGNPRRAGHHHHQGVPETLDQRRCARRRHHCHHGFGDACTIYPGKRYLDWDVADPNDRPIERVRDIRDDLQARITHYYVTSTSDPKELLMVDKPSVLFVCVHNAGRSQMAAGYLNQLSGGRIEVRSAGSEPADKVNRVAVQAMAEDGIDIANEQPKVLTTDAVKASDVVITMGCGDTCPYYPGKRYEDWVLDDPAGQGIEVVRAIGDEIRRRVEQLITELQPVQSGAEPS
jgi:protein-tyrosine-phosphatase